MPRRGNKRGKSHAPRMQTYLFEITEWEPEYSWSINQDKIPESPYREYLTLELRTTCIFPEEVCWAGRTFCANGRS